MLFRAWVATFVAMWVVPIPFYALFVVVGWLEPAEMGSPSALMLGVSLIKAGFAYGFVVLFPPDRTWLVYAAQWWIMFTALELGQVAIASNSTAYAVAGILSEAVYLPLSGLLVSRLLRPRVGA